MSILLIYNIVPDNLKVYCFHKPDKQTQDLLFRCHKYYVNSSKEDKEVQEFLLNLPEDKLVYDDQDESSSIVEVMPNAKIIVCGEIL